MPGLTEEDTEEGSFEKEALEEDVGGAHQRGFVLDRIWQVIAV